MNATLQLLDCWSIGLNTKVKKRTCKLTRAHSSSQKLTQAQSSCVGSRVGGARDSSITYFNIYKSVASRPLSEQDESARASRASGTELIMAPTKAPVATSNFRTAPSLCALTNSAPTLFKRQVRAMYTSQ